MKPPAYVSMIAAGRCVLGGDLASFRRRKLRDALVARLHRQLVESFVTFRESAGDGLSNEDLHEVIRDLIDSDACFLDDPRQGWSPADVVRELRRRDIVTERFKTIAWRGPGEWFVREE